MLEEQERRLLQEDQERRLFQEVSSNDEALAIIKESKAEEEANKVNRNLVQDEMGMVLYLTSFKEIFVEKDEAYIHWDHCAVEKEFLLA